MFGELFDDSLFVKGPGGELVVLKVMDKHAFGQYEEALVEEFDKAFFRSHLVDVVDNVVGGVVGSGDRAFLFGVQS